MIFIKGWIPESGLDSFAIRIWVIIDMCFLGDLSLLKVKSLFISSAVKQELLIWILRSDDGGDIKIRGKGIIYEEFDCASRNPFLGRIPLLSCQHAVEELLNEFSWNRGRKFLVGIVRGVSFATSCQEDELMGGDAEASG